MYKATVLYTRQGRGLYTTHVKHEARHEAKVCRYMGQNMMLEVRQRCGKVRSTWRHSGTRSETAGVEANVPTPSPSEAKFGKPRQGSEGFG